MIRTPGSRRDFLTLGLALLLAPSPLLEAAPLPRRARFAADVGILHSMMSFHLEGVVEESIDREAGRYTVHVTGQGNGIANRVESRGVLREGRWAPLETASWFQIWGRESRSQIAYDYRRQAVEYHARGETFFLRKVRVVDDVVPLPDGAVVDDALTAFLNYQDGYWQPESHGRLRTQVVRRRRGDDEGPDEVAQSYRAELVPLELRMEPDPETRRPSALVDLSGFSAWARRDRPARIVFDGQRRPALIRGSMALGTSLTIRLG